MLADPHRLQLLRQVWLFATLDDPELTQLAAVSRERTCPVGEVLVRQGDGAGDLFSVLKGRLKVESVDGGGDEVLLSVLGPGDVFGEIALLDDKPRSATVVAVEPCRLLVLPRASFRQLLGQFPTLAMRLMQVMASHVRRLSERTQDAASLDVRARLAKRLLAIADKFGVPGGGETIRITVRLSQRELGRMVGATREMVNKCLQEWKDRKIVVTIGRVLTIVNAGRLRAIAAGHGDRGKPVRRRKNVVRVITGA
jgi:CRP/FNR family cyclic AMP-dependent transcriptional regulator